MLILFSFSYIGTPLLAISQAMNAACELFIIVDAPLPPSGSLRPDIDSKDLVFENVTFEYPSRPGVRVLDKLSFHIRAGQNTALVGPSGSGKSTIVGLLERWYSLRHHYALPEVVKSPSSKEKKKDTNSDQSLPGTSKPTESTSVDAGPRPPAIGSLSGSITINGTNVEDLDARWWRAQIGLVQQEPFLFNETIFNNVANGLLGTQWENESEVNKRVLVQDACQEAYAHEFICRLPNVSPLNVITCSSFLPLFIAA
jgi:ATP-binding cassette, subfamily B (MDR/TAP), member 1